MSIVSAFTIMAKLYCFCKKPQGNRFMIACDNCDRWFHGDCVGVTKSQGSKLDVWYCTTCECERNRVECSEIKKENEELRRRKDQLALQLLACEKEKYSLLLEVNNNRLFILDQSRKEIEALREERDYLSHCVKEKNKLLCEANISQISLLDQPFEGVESFGADITNAQKSATRKDEANVSQMCLLDQPFEGVEAFGADITNAQKSATRKNEANVSQISLLGLSSGEVEALGSNISNAQKSATSEADENQALDSSEYLTTSFLSQVQGPKSHRRTKLSLAKKK